MMRRCSYECTITATTIGSGSSTKYWVWPRDNSCAKAGWFFVGVLAILYNSLSVCP